MANHTAINQCPFCDRKVQPNEPVILIEKVIGLDEKNATWYSPNPLPEDKYRVNHIGGKYQKPKNLVHLDCWNEMLDMIGLDLLSSELKARPFLDSK